LPIDVNFVGARVVGVEEHNTISVIDDEVIAHLRFGMLFSEPP